MGSAPRSTRRHVWHPIPHAPYKPGASAMGCPCPIQARSVSDCVGTTFDATPCVASDPPCPIQARSVSDCVGTTFNATPCVASDPPCPIQARSVSDGVGTTFNATPCVASDPPAHAGAFMAERTAWVMRSRKTHTSPERQRWDARPSDWRPNYFAPNLYAVFFGSKSASVKPLLVFTFM